MKQAWLKRHRVNATIAEDGPDPSIVEREQINLNEAWLIELLTKALFYPLAKLILIRDAVVDAPKQITGARFIASCQRQDMSIKLFAQAGISFQAVTKTDLIFGVGV